MAWIESRRCQDVSRGCATACRVSAPKGSAGAGSERLENDAGHRTGVGEIRIHTAVEHRVVYVAKFVEAVYVLHAFEKRSRKTSKRDVDLVRQRLRQLLLQRRSRGRA